ASQPKIVLSLFLNSTHCLRTRVRNRSKKGTGLKFRRQGITAAGRPSASRVTCTEARVPTRPSLRTQAAAHAMSDCCKHHSDFLEKTSHPNLRCGLPAKLTAADRPVRFRAPRRRRRIRARGGGVPFGQIVRAPRLREQIRAAPAIACRRGRVFANGSNSLPS